MEAIRNLTIEYATRVKAVDPQAVVLGPEEWGWSGYLYSGYDLQVGVYGLHVGGYNLQVGYGVSAVGVYTPCVACGLSPEQWGCACRLWIIDRQNCAPHNVPLCVGVHTALAPLLLTIPVQNEHIHGSSTPLFK